MGVVLSQLTDRNYFSVGMAYHLEYELYTEVYRFNANLFDRSMILQVPLRDITTHPGGVLVNLNVR